MNYKYNKYKYKYIKQKKLLISGGITYDESYNEYIKILINILSNYNFIDFNQELQEIYKLQNNNLEKKDGFNFFNSVGNTINNLYSNFFQSKTIDDINDINLLIYNLLFYYNLVLYHNINYKIDNNQNIEQHLIENNQNIVQGTNFINEQKNFINEKLKLIQPNIDKSISSDNLLSDLINISYTTNFKFEDKYYINFLKILFKLSDNKNDIIKKINNKLSQYINLDLIINNENNIIDKSFKKLLNNLII